MSMMLICFPLFHLNMKDFHINKLFVNKSLSSCMLGSNASSTITCGEGLDILFLAESKVPPHKQVAMCTYTMSLLHLSYMVVKVD